uniref:Uncharacterized protein n=1 Tax=Glossina austeni TaxID=7395 RepID=A0A1A9UZB1_GLOAU
MFPCNTLRRVTPQLQRKKLEQYESNSCIVPPLYAKGGDGRLYSQLLKCHFKEEVQNLKTAILEIADSQEFTVCFYDLLSQYLEDNEKNYNYSLSLQGITQMGEILKQHFVLSINQKVLLKSEAANGKHLQDSIVSQLNCTSLIDKSHPHFGQADVVKSIKEKWDL